MDLQGMVIEVSGLPDNYPRESIIDKLSMHFLRRSNNGGDVLTVIYPTSIKGQAYVVFELPEVSEVLHHTHVLEINGHFYPLDIKKGFHPELDMPVEAWLDVNLFSRQREIKTLLKKYSFIVSETSSGQLHLQGSFLKLKAIRPKLMQILSEETQTQRTTSSPYTNGYSSGSVSKTGSSESTPRHRHINGNSGHARVKSPSAGATSGSPESQKNLPLSWSGSPQDRDYSTPVCLPPPRQTEASFPVDKDVFRYTMCFKKDIIKTIESDYSVLIRHEEDQDVFTVKLVGGDCEKAAKELSRFIQDITSTLRTQKIDIKELDSKQKGFISQQAETVQNVHKVLITQHGDTIKVVGSSFDSYEAKQRLLGKKAETPVAGVLQKKLRRSISLPRQTTKSRIDDLDARKSPDTEVAAAGGYFASRYQTDSISQQPLHQERGRQATRALITQRSRVETTSEPRYKKREDKAPPPYEQDLSPPSGARTSKKKQTPKILTSLMDISLLHRKKHKQHITHV